MTDEFDNLPSVEDAFSLESEIVRWAGMALDNLETFWRNRLVELAADGSLTETTIGPLTSLLARRFSTPVAAMRRMVTELIHGVDDVGPETHGQWARRLLTTNTYVGDLGRLWRLDDELIWHEVTEEEVIDVISSWEGPTCKSRNDYKGIAKLAVTLARDPNWRFDDRPVGAAIGDEFVFYEAGELKREPLNAAHMCRLKLAAPEDKPSPKLDKFIDDSFPPWDVKSEVRKELFSQHLFASVFGLTARIQKALLWFGPTASGKTTAQKLLASLISSDLTSSIGPDSWDKATEIGVLAGKRLNLAGELNHKKLLGTEFLSVVGDEAILTGRRLYGDPFTFRSKASHVFNTNEMPRTFLRNEAFYRRWSILNFAHTTKQKNRQNDLAENIISDEFDALVAFMLKGESLLHDGRLDFITDDSGDRMRDWKVENNTVLGFLLDDEWCSSGGEDDMVGRQFFYKVYAEWTRSNGYKAVSSREFKRVLEGLEESEDSRNELGYPLLKIRRHPENATRMWSGVVVTEVM